MNVITGGSGADTITAGNGGNFIDGGDGANILTSGAGNDTILSGTGDDTIVAGAGNDVVTIHGGADTVHAGAGGDLFIVDDAPSVTAVTMTAPSGSVWRRLQRHHCLFQRQHCCIRWRRDLQHHQRIRERFLYDRRWQRSAGRRRGQRHAAGAGGNDVLIGGAGNDSWMAGPGSDTASYADAAAGVGVSLGAARRGPGHDRRRASTLSSISRTSPARASTTP